MRLPDWPLPVWPGTMLLIPFDSWSERDGSSMVVRDDRGRALETSVWEFAATAERSTWNGVMSRWTARRVDVDAGEAGGRAAGGAGALLMLAVDVPPEFHAQELVVGGRRVGVDVSPALVESAWVSPFPEFADWAPLLEAIRADESSPLLRWRGRLLRAGVPDDPSRPAPALEDGMVRALAVQEELRWRAGLSRVHAADPDLAQRVRRRLLVSVQDEASGRTVAAWGGAGLEQLRDIVMDPRVSGRALATRVRTWLDRQPAAIAWIDRASVEPIAGAGGGWGMARAWAGNLGEEAALAWVEVRGAAGAGSGVPEPRLLRPGELASLDAPVRMGASSELVDLEVHVGGWVVRDRVTCGASPATPPGVVLGPLRPSIVASEAVSLDRPDERRLGACVGLLRRLDPSGLAPGSLAARGRWSVLVDVIGPALDGATLSLVFAHEGGRTSVEFDREGRLVVVAPTGFPTGGYAAQGAVAATASGWSIEVPVPEWCPGLDGTLSVGLVADAGVRGLWSWPSRIALVDGELRGLALIDLSAWDGTGGAVGAAPEP